MDPGEPGRRRRQHVPGSRRFLLIDLGELFRRGRRPDAEGVYLIAAGAQPRAVLPDGLGWQNGAGNVMGVYLHGLFEDPAVLRALFGAAVPTLDAVFDGLADYVDAHVAPGCLESLLGRSVTPVPSS